MRGDAPPRFATALPSGSFAARLFQILILRLISVFYVFAHPHAAAIPTTNVTEATGVPTELGTKRRAPLERSPKSN